MTVWLAGGDSDFQRTGYYAYFAGPGEFPGSEKESIPFCFLKGSYSCRCGAYPTLHSYGLGIIEGPLEVCGLPHRAPNGLHLGE